MQVKFCFGGGAVKKILVVDDEEMILEVFREAFSRVGYTVVCAKSGREALDILEQDRVSVMFLDLNMPGMDGLELCRRIRQNRPDASIFAVTGYASFYDVEDCRRAGFDDYFAKPVDLAVLYRAAKDAFERLEESGGNDE